MSNYMPRHTYVPEEYIRMFITTLFILRKKPRNNPNVHQQIQSSSLTVKSYIEMKMSELELHATSWIQFLEKKIQAAEEYKHDPT